ncbi:MAG: hypothetical protein ACFFB5_06150 [Promethearchaeota archaeon]
MLIRKRNYISSLIVIILCMGILVSFNSLITGTDHTKQLADHSQLSNTGIESQQPSSEVSIAETTTVDFSWSSWYDEYDNDSDGKYDTIEIFYEFSDFTVTEWVEFEIEIEIYYWDQGWDYLDDYDDWFEAFVEPGETYIWSYRWGAWYNGNYSFAVTVYDYSTDKIVIEETITWYDASEFIFLNDWERWIVEYDRDGDNSNDTIYIWYFFNFTFSGWVDLQFRMEIYYWDMYWDYIDYRYERFWEDVTAGEVYNMSFLWSAWYDGDYNFSIRIRSYESDETIIEEWVVWNDASSFSYFSNYDRWVDKSDEDGDGCEDTISIEYSFNFTFSGEVELEIWIEIYHWKGYWDEITDEWDYFEEDVKSGEVYNVSFQWSAWYEGDYNFSIRVRDEYSDRELIKEWVDWSDACAFTLLDNWTSWTIEHDEDNDGCDDTIELGYDFKFSYTGQVYIRIRVEIRYWNPDHQGWDWIDDYYEYIEEAVTSGEQLTWSLRWQARDSGRYEFYVDIEERNFDIPLLEESFEWYADCAYNPIKEWDRWYREYDKDTDGCDDTIEIGFDMLFSVTGSITLNLRAQIHVWSTEYNEWDYFDYYHDEFTGEIKTNIWYYISFEWSAWEAGDYKLEIEIFGESGGTLIEDTIDWENACAFEALDSWKSWYEEYDEDNDGCKDTIEIGYDLQFTFSGEAHLSLFADIRHWNEQQEYWEEITYYYQHFQIQVTAGDLETISFRWPASEDGDFKFEILIYDSTADGKLIDILIDDTIEWFEACKYHLIKDWNIYYYEYDADSDGLTDTIEVGFDMTFSKSGPVSLYAMMRINYWNEEKKYWQEIDAYVYDFFSEDVKEGSWYSINISWSAVYTGDYNISVRFVDLRYFYSTIQIEEWIAWSDVTGYQGVEFEWEPIHEDYYEDRPDSIDIGYEFLFSQSGSVDFDIRVIVLYLDYTTMKFDVKQIFWGSFKTDVIEGKWYGWVKKWDLTGTEGYQVYFFITIFDGRARILDDMVSLYAYAYEKPRQILPIETTSSTTTTTTTEEEESSSTATSTPNITPGWTVAAALLTILSLIISIRRVKRKSD